MDEMRKARIHIFILLEYGRLGKEGGEKALGRVTGKERERGDREIDEGERESQRQLARQRQKEKESTSERESARDS